MNSNGYRGNNVLGSGGVVQYGDARFEERVNDGSHGFRCTAGVNHERAILSALP